MKSFNRIALIGAMVGVLLSSIVGAAGAQTENPTYLAVVNGASTDPVVVDANGTELAPSLAYPDGASVSDAVSQIVGTGSYTVTFTGPTVVSDATVDLAPGFAQTVVSGFGDNGETAKGYPIDTTPVGADSAKYAFWNASTADVDVTIGTAPTETVAPGAGLEAKVVGPDTSVEVVVGGVTRTFVATADSYTDIFAVDDGVTPTIALAVVPSMTDLLAEIAPPAGGVTVPDVIGQTEADANATITGAGLVAATTEAADDTVPAGNVISQDPAAGATADAGSTVSIVVSTGPDAPATVPVPDVAGQQAADAQTALEAEGFTVVTTEQPSMDVEAGLVIETNPAAGTEVAPGTEVMIIVSSGAEDVVVPDFTGMSTEDATTAAEDAGLMITFVEDANNPDP
ncbi:Serine/threonine protein kinase PrkC, regulator of stationary phase, partial [hydrothermal vent metagenome]